MIVPASAFVEASAEACLPGQSASEGAEAAARLVPRQRGWSSPYESNTFLLSVPVGVIVPPGREQPAVISRMTMQMVPQPPLPWRGVVAPIS